jgi:adenine-specific DNA-methyltransferase
MAVEKVSNISGNYSAYNKIWDPRTKKSLTLKFIEVIPSKFKHNAFNEDSFDLIKKINCDLIYIDPPYNSRQYITNYHLLETIAKYDNPKISGKTGIRAYAEKEKSIFCSKKMVNSALLKLLNVANAKYIILSYNSEGFLSKDDILKIFEESQFKDVKLYEFPYRRFKSTKNSYNNKINEYIFVGKR